MCIAKKEKMKNTNITIPANEKISTQVTKTQAINWELINGTPSQPETKLDEVKSKSNRLVSISGKIRFVIMSNGEEREIVGKRAWNKFSKENDFVTDF